MSVNYTRPPVCSWFLCLAGLIGLFVFGYTRLAPAPVTVPDPVATIPPNFTLPLKAPVAAPELAPFDPDTDEYVLFAFPSTGLQSLSSGRINLGGEPVAYGIQILRRDTTPEETPGETKVNLSNTLHSFEFPLAGVKAEIKVAADNGEKTVELETAVVAAQSAAWGCGKCHGRDKGHDDRAGLAPVTVNSILKAHDRLNGTDLLAQVKRPNGVDCASCHSLESALPNLSAAVHGVHALMDLPEDERACNSCHPADSQGTSLLQRDLHADMGIGCTSCHGTLREHALALLKAETGAEKKPAAKRFAQLSARKGSGLSPDEINPRLPGENLPDCTGCHNFSEHPVPGEVSAFNKWTEKSQDRFSRRFDYTGKLRCPTCHGTPHVMYPAKDLVGDNRDNFQATRYLKEDGPMGSKGSCGVCHRIEMDYFVHHGLPE